MRIHKAFPALILIAANAIYAAPANAEARARIVSVSGDAQTIVAGHSASPFVVYVSDQDGAPVSGVTVWFDVASCTGDEPCPPWDAYGNFSGKTTANVITDRTGHGVAPVFTAGKGAASYGVVAHIPEQSAGGRPVRQVGEPALFVIEQTSESGTPDFRAAGLYYDPTRNGEGIQITFGVANGLSTFAATWYTYEQGKQIWLLASAEYAGSSAPTQVVFAQTSGANFGPAFKPSDVKTVVWGTATLQWHGCNQLAVRYNRADGLTGDLTLTRLLYDDVSSGCN